MRWAAVLKMAREDPWLFEALEWSRDYEDERKLRKDLQGRVEESISFIAFRPFEKADPLWYGHGEFHPMFHESRRPGSDGVYYYSFPLVVYRYRDLRAHERSPYHFIHLDSLSGASVGSAMNWRLERDGGHPVIFEAIVKPFHVRISPHRMVAESYEIFKIPKDLDVRAWCQPALSCEDPKVQLPF